jgi:hypothetical protein
MVTTRVQARTAIRQAAIDLLNAYASDAEMQLQVYKALPTTIRPPTAFIERIDEVASFPGINQRQRTLQCQVVLLFRLFVESEREAAADQQDAFIDAFMDWVEDRFHQPGPTELISATRVRDEPEYVVLRRAPDGRTSQVTYFGARITLEGYTAN